MTRAKAWISSALNCVVLAVATVAWAAMALVSQTAKQARRKWNRRAGP